MVIFLDQLLQAKMSIMRLRHQTWRPRDFDLSISPLNRTKQSNCISNHFLGFCEQGHHSPVNKSIMSSILCNRDIRHWRPWDSKLSVSPSNKDQAFQGTTALYVRKFRRCLGIALRLGGRHNLDSVSFFHGIS